MKSISRIKKKKILQSQPIHMSVFHQSVLSIAKSKGEEYCSVAYECNYDGHGRYRSEFKAYIAGGTWWVGSTPQEVLSQIKEWQNNRNPVAIDAIVPDDLPF